MRSIACLIAVVVWSVVCSSCAVSTPSPESLEFQDRSAQVQQLARKVAERDRALQSMQTDAVMEYTSPDRHPPKVREQITAKRPDSLRVEAMSAFSVALILATSGKHLAIFEPSKNKLVRAAATAETLNQFIQIPMAPADAVTLLLGIAPGSASLAERKPDTVATEDGLTVAAWAIANGAHRELGFTNDQLAMVRERAASGEVDYEVRYREYQDLGGLMFPYVVDATFPVAQSRVTFHYKRPIINGEVPDSAFVLSPPTANQQANAIR